MRSKVIITFDWNCSTVESFPGRSLRRLALRAIPADDRGRLGTWADRAFVVRLTTERVYFVPLVCGATGNCSWGLFTLNPAQFLGQVDGEFIYTYRSSERWPTIITYTHMSAAKGILGTYEFRGGKYRWLHDGRRVSYLEFNKRPLPRFLEKARSMCKDYGG